MASVYTCSKCVPKYGTAVVSCLECEHCFCASHSKEHERRYPFHTEVINLCEGSERKANGGSFRTVNYPSQLEQWPPQTRQRHLGNDVEDGRGQHSCDESVRDTLIFRKDCDDDKLEFWEENLANILRPVNDLPVVVLSVAGPLRTGKSYLINHLIHRLEQAEAAGGDLTSSWSPPDRTAKLGGLPWSGGSDPVTKGILMWRKAYRIRTRRHGQVAIVLMDVQGSFDQQSSLTDVASMFSLSMLLSSVQIFNLKQQPNENDLQHLQLFVDFGIEESGIQGQQGHKPFQKLLFLVRDKAEESDRYPFGAKGGQKFIEHFLQTHRGKNIHKDNQRVREHLMGFIDEVTCFLMPAPGKEVTKTQFNGTDSQDEEFNEFLKILIDHILNENSFDVKRGITGQPMTGAQLMRLAENYYGQFASGVATLKSAAEVRLYAAKFQQIDEAKKIISNILKMNMEIIQATENIEEAKQKFKDMLDAVSDTAAGFTEQMNGDRDMVARLANDVKEMVETYTVSIEALLKAKLKAQEERERREEERRQDEERFNQQKLEMEEQAEKMKAEIEAVEARSLEQRQMWERAEQQHKEDRERMEGEMAKFREDQIEERERHKQLMESSQRQHEEMQRQSNQAMDFMKTQLETQAKALADQKRKDDIAIATGKYKNLMRRETDDNVLSADEFKRVSESCRKKAKVSLREVQMSAHEEEMLDDQIDDIEQEMKSENARHAREIERDLDQKVNDALQYYSAMMSSSTGQYLPPSEFDRISSQYKTSAMLKLADCDSARKKAIEDQIGILESNLRTGNSNKKPKESSSSFLSSFGNFLGGVVDVVSTFIPGVRAIKGIMDIGKK